MKLWTLAAVAVISALALSSCSSSSGSNGNVVTRKPGPEGYDPSLCADLCPDSGGLALYENLGVDRPVTSDLFDKRYNRATLEAVLAASITETQNYAIRDGIRLFKVPSEADNKKYPLQYALDPIPKDLRDEEWDQNASSNSAGGWLDGLFTYKNQSRVIMVREDAGRWTLVHEMMHANFFRQRMLDRTPTAHGLDQRIRGAFDQIERSLKAFDTSKDQQDMLDAATAAASLTPMQFEVLSQTTLEEVAVESLLGEEYRAGRLKYVNPEALFSSARYIEANENKAAPDLDLLEASIIRVKEKAAAAGLFDSANDLQKSLDAIAAMKTRLAELLSIAKKSWRASEPRNNSLSGALVFEAAPQSDADVLLASEANAERQAQAPLAVTFRTRLIALNKKLQK